MWRLLVLPIALQAVVMLVDEFYFHRRRGLPRWERIGHPIDTLSVLACYAWLLAVPPSASAIGAYIALATLSTLLVTKDEFVHARLCTGGEHWLHAVLFALHPVVLGCAGLLWPAAHGPWAAGDDWRAPAADARPILLAQLGATALFGLYQALYWNVPRRADADRGPTAR